MSLSDIDQSLPAEEQLTYHRLRESILDAFVSIINGIISPEGQQMAVDQQQVVNESLHSMFYYLNSLLEKEDLQLTQESSRLIYELYGDIIGLQSNTDLQTLVRSSSMKSKLDEKLAPFVRYLSHPILNE